MIIYNNEIQDGLESSLKNSSIAFEMNIEPASFLVQNPTLEAPAKASTNDLDLYHFNSILVSVGWNKNDDVFLPSEVWNARNTPVLKKVNFEHNEKDIIGVITASIPLVNNKIYDQEEVPNAFDLVVSSVLYSKWEDENLQKRMDNIISEIAKGEWFVSMECLFRGFDYALAKEGENKIVKRNAETSFLTKHLKWYGGNGTWNGYSVGRVLNDIIFSGKGLVRKPANSRSIILTKAFEQPKTVEYIMDPKELMDKLSKTEEKAAKAEALAEKLQEELNAKVALAQKAEKERLEKDLHKRDLTIAEQKEELDKTSALVKELTEKVESVTKELNTAKVTASELVEKLAKIETEKAVAERIARLMQVGVLESKAQEIVEKWKNASAEQFSDIVELHKTSKVEAPKESLNPDISTATEVVAPAIPKEEPSKANELQTALASWLTNIVNTPFSKKN